MLETGFVFKYITFHRDSHAQSVMHNMHFNTITESKKNERKLKRKDEKKEQRKRTNP